MLQVVRHHRVGFTLGPKLNTSLRSKILRLKYSCVHHAFLFLIRYKSQAVLFLLQIILNPHFEVLILHDVHEAKIRPILWPLMTVRLINTVLVAWIFAFDTTLRLHLNLLYHNVLFLLASNLLSIFELVHWVHFKGCAFLRVPTLSHFASLSKKIWLCWRPRHPQAWTTATEFKHLQGPKFLGSRLSKRTKLKSTAPIWWCTFNKHPIFP